MMQKP
jgi:hypothetical protein